MTDYTDALCGLSQQDLDDCDQLFSAERGGVHAFLCVGPMHGVSVVIADHHDRGGLVPVLVRDGVVLRFLIPHGTTLEELAQGLAEGGCLSRLIDRLLPGHLLSLTAAGATGRLTGEAAILRDALLDAVGSLGAPAPVAAGALPMLSQAAPEPLAIH